MFKGLLGLEVNYSDEEFDAKVGWPGTNSSLTWRTLFKGDGLHPNDKGIEIINQALADKLSEVLC